MSKEFPKEITISAHTIPIVVSEHGLDKEDFGEYSEFDMRITIRPHQESIMLDTFFHEVVEAINAIYELDLPHPKIQTLGAALAQALGHLIRETGTEHVPIPILK